MASRSSSQRGFDYGACGGGEEMVKKISKNISLILLSRSMSQKYAIRIRTKVKVAYRIVASARILL
jgi:hypothetical protein